MSTAISAPAPRVRLLPRIVSHRRDRGPGTRFDRVVRTSRPTSYSRDDFAVDRSADGASLDFGFNLEGIEGDFLVRSDATAFDANGTFFLEMDFEPSGVSRRTAFAAFPPAADGPGPNPIPLPPAAWAALVTMTVYGGAGGLRRGHLRRRGA